MAHRVHRVPEDCPQGVANLVAACTEVKPSDRPSARRVRLLPGRRQSDRCAPDVPFIETVTGCVPLVRTFYRFPLLVSSLARWVGPQRTLLPSRAFLQCAGCHVAAPVMGSALPSVGSLDRAAACVPGGGAAGGTRGGAGLLQAWRRGVRPPGRGYPGAAGEGP